MKNFCLLLCMFLVIVPMSASARVADTMILERIGRYAFGTWAYGDGSQTLTKTFCTASSNYSNAFSDPPPVKNPPAIHEAYQFKVMDRNTPAGFFMYLNSVDTNTGNAKLAIQVEHRDIKDGNTWETLVDDVYGSHAHNGQFKRCNNGDNSQLRITILSTALEQARAGSYGGLFTGTGQGGSSGTNTSSKNFSATLNVAPIVRIDGLANVSLGTYSGGGDINVEESFCVYSNSDTAAYDVTITSPNQDISGDFFLLNGAATDLVAYTLYFKDNLTPGVGTQVLTAPIAGAGNNSANDCGGSDNAKISVNVLDGDMSVVPSDSYSDTLTVLVAPL
jgi:hypothetical protein